MQRAGLSMANLENMTRGSNAALVVLAFLQADCRSAECREELRLLRDDIHPSLDINCNDPGRDAWEDGDLEADGHLCSSITASLGDIQPIIDLPGEGNDAGAIQQVAEELRHIAAELEHNAVARATERLSMNIQQSPSNRWKDYLTWEVDRVMRECVHLDRGRVIVPLTLTLVKGVCERTPRLLRNLFNVALEYISAVGAR